MNNSIATPPNLPPCGAGKLYLPLIYDFNILGPTLITGIIMLFKCTAAFQLQQIQEHNLSIISISYIF